MIKNFTFENFLSFQGRAVFSMAKRALDKSHKEALFKANGENLLKTAVVYGPNASGKSSLLKAFVFFQQFVTVGLQLSLTNNFIQVVPFLLNTKTENAPSFFEIEIIKNGKTYLYGFEVTREKVLKEWLHEYPNKKILFERDDDEIKGNPRYFKEATVNVKKQTRANVLFLTVLASYNGEISKGILEEILKIQVFPADLKDVLIEYSFQKFDEYKKEILELMLEADFGITTMNVDQKEVNQEEFEKPLPLEIRNLVTAGKKKFMHRRISTIHKKYSADGKAVAEVEFDFLAQESAGTKQMFAISGLIMNTLKEGGTLFMDELDSSLHPLLCRFILKLFNSKERNPKNAQLIFTTHDVSLLDRDVWRRDQIWFTEKDKCGASKLFSLADLGEREGMNFSKRYFEGRYGALPYIGSLEPIEQI